MCYPLSAVETCGPLEFAFGLRRDKPQTTDFLLSISGPQVPPIGRRRSSAAPARTCHFIVPSAASQSPETALRQKKSIRAVPFPVASHSRGSRDGRELAKKRASRGDLEARELSCILVSARARCFFACVFAAACFHRDGTRRASPIPIHPCSPPVRAL